MIFLEVPFKEKDAAKKLGARWDPLRKKWYIPEDKLDQQDLFSRWLPAQSGLPPVPHEESEALSLSQLLQQVEQVIHGHFIQALWVRAEIAELSHRRHLYLHLVESNLQGEQLASVRAMIWQNRLDTLLHKFKQATGSPLEKGQKVLLKVQVRFHSVYGLSLDIEDIDPNYTLGDIQAQLAKLRAQLKQLGLYDRNQQLPLPQDYFHIAVIAPPQAAGLGDFQRDAQQLQQYDLCQFHYFHASFQGDQVESEFMAAFDAIEALHKKSPFDVLVIIRGGGAQLDLHHLNKLSIAQRIAQAPIPVFTGIGHERDNTLLDEISAKRFDTPSKVIAAIRDTIVQNALTSKQHWQLLQHSVLQHLKYAQHQLQKQQYIIDQHAQKQLFKAQQQLKSTTNRIQHLALRYIQHHSHQLLILQSTIQHRAQQPLKVEKTQLKQWLDQVKANVQHRPRQAKQNIEGLIRYILSAGPQAQLKRGFVMVQDEAGQVIRTAQAARSKNTLQLRFSDGEVKVKVES